MPKNVAQKLIESHLIEGEITPGTRSDSESTTS
jgi:hypothetical protein